MARPRRKVFTMRQYIDNLKEGYIANNVSTQRNPAWKPIIDGLVVTILNDDYISPIILSERNDGLTVILDGGSRTAAFRMICEGNNKIKSTVEDPIIQYKKIEKDENGKIVFTDAEFDIRNKTFEQFPKELQKRFYEYQLETVIYNDCDKEQESKYQRRYNSNTGMNTNQKMFLYIPKFADQIREIMDRPFFVNCNDFKDNEKEKGILERVIAESIMCMFHIDKWKKQTKKITQYLNVNSSEEEFIKLDDNLHRLENVVADDIKDIFNSKNSFIWLTLFHRFTSLGLDDDKFADFLRAFKNGLKDTTVNGQTFDDADKARSTKDKAVVLKKINIAESLMFQFLHIDNEASSTDEEISDKTNIVKIKDITSKDIVMEFIDNSTDDGDIELFEMIANDISESIDDINTPILSEENRPSFVAIVAYASKNDVDELLKEWLKNNYQDIQFIKDQKQNYLHMKKCFEKYCEKSGQEWGVS